MVNPQGNNTLWRWDGSPRHPASRIAVPVDHTQGGQVLDLCHLHLPDLGVLLAKEVGWDSFWSFCSTVYNINYFKHDWPDDIFLLLSGGVLKRIAVCKPSICIYIQSHTYCILYIYLSKKTSIWSYVNEASPFSSRNLLTQTQTKSLKAHVGTSWYSWAKKCNQFPRCDSDCSDTPALSQTTPKCF